MFTSSHRVTISRDAPIHLPDRCPRCLAHHPTVPHQLWRTRLVSHVILAYKTEKLRLPVPWCGRCCRRGAFFIGLIAAATGVLAGAMAGLYCWSISHSYLDLCFAQLFALPLGVMPGLVFAGLFDNPTGVHVRRFNRNFIEFSFKNPEYAGLFKSANHQEVYEKDLVEEFRPLFIALAAAAIVYLALVR